MDVFFKYGQLEVDHLKKKDKHLALDKPQFEKYRKRYSPYGPVASLYLWRLVANSLN